MFSAAPPPAIACDELSRMTLPAVVSCGGATRPLFRIQVDAIMRCMPNARLLVAPQRRHGWPSADAELFRRSLLDFLVVL